MKQKKLILGMICCLCAGMLTACVSEEQMEEWAQELHDKVNQEATEDLLAREEISETAKYMAQEILDEIIKPGMSELEKAITIHDWLMMNLEYDDSHTYYHAEDALLLRTCVSEGYTECFHSMAEMAGLEATIVRGNLIYANGNVESHAWNQVKIDGDWYNVDVTRDDRLGSCYQYFLISEEDIANSHTAIEFLEGKKECNETYNRNQIFKYAASSGIYGDVVFVESVEDANLGIEKAMQEGKDSLKIWLLDLSEPEESNTDYISRLISQLNYYVSPGDSFSISSNGLIVFDVSFHNASEWEAFPVVKDVHEFRELLDEMGKKATKSYVVRYEPTEGEPIISAASYRCKVSYHKYNDGKYWLITVTVQY